MITAKDTTNNRYYYADDLVRNAEADRDRYRGMYLAVCESLKEVRDLLWDVMCSGITDPYPTCKYVEVQIDKRTWNAIPAALKKEEVNGHK